MRSEKLQENLKLALQNKLKENKTIKTEGARLINQLFIDEEGITFEPDNSADTDLPAYYNNEEDRNALIGTSQEIIDDMLNVTGDKEYLEAIINGAGYTLDEFEKLSGKLVLVMDTTGYDCNFNQKIYKLEN